MVRLMKRKNNAEAECDDSVSTVVHSETNQARVLARETEVRKPLVSLPISESGNAIRQPKKQRFVAPILQKPTVTTLPPEIQLSSFKTVLAKLGIIVHDSTAAELDGVLLTTVQANVKHIIDVHSAGTEKAVESFVAGIAKHIENPLRFYYTMLPLTSRSEHDDSWASIACKDSLLRLLANVETLQMAILKLLLEKIVEGFDFSSTVMPGIANSINFVQLILSQFRCLDFIVDSKELLEQIIEIISLVPSELKKEIITSIPHLIDDSQHEEAASRLKDLMLGDNELVLSVVEALANLQLSPDLAREVQTSILRMLASADVADLPVMIKFLLQNASEDDAQDLIHEIRINLDLNSIKLSESEGLQNNTSEANMRTPSQKIIEVISGALRFQRFLANAWIEVIDGLKNAAAFTTLDFLVLVALHAVYSKKLVEGLLRNKIRSGSLTIIFLEATFKSQQEVLRDYFDSILALSEVLLQSTEAHVQNFAAAMYRCAFCSFDSYCCQEIVANLITHIGSGLLFEIDASFDVLCGLVNADISKMAPLTVFVKSILDYVDQLTLSHLRKLFSILGVLAYKGEELDLVLQEELHMMLRKQLSNNAIKYQRMGVVAATTLVTVLTRNRINNSQRCPLDMVKEATSLLKLVWTSCSRSPQILALYLDELATLVNSGHSNQQIEQWIDEDILSDFQDIYVVDIDPSNKEGVCELPMCLQYGLDDEAEGAIAINLLSLLVKSVKKNVQPTQKQTLSPLCLASYFRLLQLCEKRQQAGSLEGIDALLGCPLQLPKPELIAKFNSLSSQEKELLCTSLFLTVNWFCEVLNAFSGQNNPEMKAKLINRLVNITEILNQLEMCLGDLPGYIPPSANGSIEMNKPILPVTISKSVKSKKTKAGKSRKKKREDVNDGSDESKDSTAAVTTIESSRLVTSQKSQQKSLKEYDFDETDTPAKPQVSMNQIKVYLRELDFDVFNILQVEFITKAMLDTNLLTRETTTVRLQPAQLNYLLQDLAAKLQHCFLINDARRPPFAKASPTLEFNHINALGITEVVARTLKLLDALCQHLESSSAFFQSMLTANDGILDGPGYSRPECQHISSCFDLLLQCLHAFFSWQGFTAVEHKRTLVEALGILSSRLNTFSTSQMAVKNLSREVFTYLENFSNTIPNISAAVNLVKLLDTIAKLGDLLKDNIAQVCHKFLKQSWLTPDGEADKGSKYNACLQQLLRYFIDYSDDPASAIEGLVLACNQSVADNSSAESSDSFPTITRQSMAVFYKAMFGKLVELAKLISPAKPSDPVNVKIDRLNEWNRVGQIFNVLINFVKNFDHRSILSTALKNGRQVLELFLKNCMPILDILFRSHRESVQGLLKIVQQSTRFMQHLCGHSKILKDVALTTQVPQLKKCLEGLVFRVKAMLDVNQCLEAFWLGNLKNRNIQGEEILSQAVRDRNEDDNDDDDDADNEEPSNEDAEPNNDNVTHHNNDNSDSEEEEMVVETDEDESAVGASYSETY